MPGGGGALVIRLGLLLMMMIGLVAGGCATRPPAAAPRAPAARVQAGRLSPAVVERILALDPERVTQQDVRELLTNAPAPHILKIHGGLFPIQAGMNSFARFLIRLGYPEASLRDPGTGSFTYGHYDDSEIIAGTVAWYYERDGLRPMLVGHSVGGIEVVRVLHALAGTQVARVAVWNPETGREEPRCAITDPFTGRSRPVVGLKCSFAAASVAGGLARVLPGQWDMYHHLRQIPDSVEEFAGFQKGFDMLGGDWLGYGSANEYRAVGSARVHNVRLPALGSHTTIPYAGKLLDDPGVMEWIDHYTSLEPGPAPDFGGRNARALWAAVVWHGIKKHWVIELQRLLLAQRAGPNEH